MNRGLFVASQRQRARTATGAAALLLVTAVAGVAQPTVRAADVPGAGDASARDAAIRFRQAFGLDTSTALLESLTVSNSNVDWGVPLTAAEAADIANRSRIAQGKEQLHQAIDQIPGYAGLFTDQAHGGTIVLRFTSWDTATTSSIAEAMPTAATWRIEAADYSQTTLHESRAAVEAALPEMIGHGFAISAVGIDPISDRVRIGLDPYDASVAQSIAQRFGPTVLVDAEAAPAATACTSRDACSAPWRAGVWISHNYPFDPVINCTSGFVARPTTGATSGHFFMMTAGHCIWDAGGSGKNWWQGTSANIGNATSTWEYWNYANVDAGIIAITSAQFPTNWAYGNTATDTITGSISSSFQAVGDPVCRAGWAFWKATGVGYQCNTVVATDQTVHDTRHDFYIHHQWQGWLTSKDGDSGGPVMSGHDALGIAAYAAGNSTWYSPIDWISRELGYRPCYTTYSNPCG